MTFLNRYVLLIISIAYCVSVQAQSAKIYWVKKGNAYCKLENGEIIHYGLPKNEKTVLVTKSQLIPQGQSNPLRIDNFSFSGDNTKLLIYTNSKKVWRLNTRGDYWLFNLKTHTLNKIGKERPESSLMFAKFSPDASQVAYVSDYNLYVEDLSTAKIKQLTADGNRKLINGTFDWAYEEEFFCRDGFRWSPDGKKIAFWQIDARNVNDYMMVNNTDSIYPVANPVEYPIAGDKPSPYKIGVITISNASMQWMNVPNEPLQNYVPRMEWASNANELIVQQLNRKQNQSDLFICNASTGESQTIYREKDSAWLDILPSWDQDYIWGGWDWINNGKEFIWASEKDGWRHLYRISRDGKKEVLITRGNYDVIDISSIDEKAGYIYFMASPGDATQNYLFRTRIDGKGKLELISDRNQKGTHSYKISPGARYALHSFTNHYTPTVREWISLPDHKGLAAQNSINDSVAKYDGSKSKLRFFKIKNEEGTEMDGWMLLPDKFDSTKRYPVVFYVYTEPWGQNVKDEFGTEQNLLYRGDMSNDGYLYISVDNRGTPVPKGRAWRKSIHRKIGRVNIQDQAFAAKQILNWPFVDSSRVAVWGWSGGGSATLNLMFQFPEIYKTGIAIAAVANQLTYDNIYQERYMGLPQENLEDFVKGSPVTYAKNLKGSLLYIHGTGDDNVHYNNAEILINELIKHKKQFQFMPYPNRTHSLSEGEGTWEHLSLLYTQYLKKNCPPGPR